MRYLLALMLMTATVHAQSVIEKYCFSPDGGCTQLWVDTIKDAASRKESIVVEAYYLTSKAILTELVAAKEAGSSVEVIVDSSQPKLKGRYLDILKKATIYVMVDRQHKIFHNKILITDTHVLTGSFNLTQSAEHVNAENDVLINGKEAVAAYMKAYNVHRAHADTYADGKVQVAE